MALKRKPARRISAEAFGGGPSSFIDPAAQLASMSAGFEANPGRAPGGTGSTGLLSNDRQGYSDMLNQQQQFLQLQDYMGGGSGVDTAYNPDYTSTRTFDPATARDNSAAFGLPSSVSGGAIEGLDRAIRTGTGAAYQPHDKWMAAHAPRKRQR